MILRRVMHHVRDQNWFAVGIDFIIVVAGILISFQISNPNEARHARANDERALIDLRRDVSDIYWCARERLVVADCRRSRDRELASPTTYEELLFANIVAAESETN